MAKKGFYYEVSEDTLKKWIATPASEKLEWLEEINTFIFKFTGKKQKAIISKFRKGEI
ncbi:MAG: hypothetical protein V3V36_04530 [Candidatus Hydrothermarchaeaceae archaeon]